MFSMLAFIAAVVAAVVAAAIPVCALAAFKTHKLVWYGNTYFRGRNRQNPE